MNRPEPAPGFRVSIPPDRPNGGGTVYVDPSQSSEEPAGSDGSPAAPDLLAQVPDGVSWENQFDHSVRTVRLELSGAPRVERYGFGWRDEKVLFQPQTVELIYDNGRRRSVSVRGPRVLKNGELGLRFAESYYSFTKDDEHMPEWLKRLVAEVSA